MALLADDSCLQRNAWICGEYVSTRSAEILAALSEHVTLTASAVAIGTLLSVPLVVVARRWRFTASWISSVTSILYTVPSLAFFAVLLPFTGLSATTVRIGLVAYTLVILFRGFLAAVDAVPDQVREAARGMGYGQLRLFATVEVPLALPTMAAALRVATVSTIALVTVGSAIGHGGLGNLIYDGLGSEFKSEVLTVSVLCVVLAVAADLAIIAIVRILTPWRRRRGWREAAPLPVVPTQADATSMIIGSVAK